MEIFEQALKQGIYVAYACEDTNSLGIYYIAPENLRVENNILKSNYKEFKLEDYNKDWSLYKEALE